MFSVNIITFFMLTILKCTDYSVDQNVLFFCLFFFFCFFFFVYFYGLICSYLLVCLTAFINNVNLNVLIVILLFFFVLFCFNIISVIYFKCT